MNLIKTLKQLALGAVLTLSAASAQAHIIGLGWTFETNGDVTFDALHWHGAHGAAGNLNIDGVNYAFTSATHNTATMTGLDGALVNSSYSSYNAGTGVLSAIASADDWLHVTISGLSAGAHTITSDWGPGGLTSWTLDNNVTTVGITTPTNVSEPATLAIFGLALAGFGFARRNKNS